VRRGGDGGEDSGGDGGEHRGGDGGGSDEAAEPAAAAITTLSYSSLSEYERCGYRFYLERVLRLPGVAVRGTDGAELSATERGVLVHQLLEELDFRNPRIPPAPEDVTRLLEDFLDSQLFQRLAGSADLRRE